MRSVSKNEIINQYNRLHRKVKLRSIHYKPRWFIKYEGKKDAKKNLIQKNQISFWVLEKSEILKQKIRTEISYIEKLLYDVREESGALIQEYYKNEYFIKELESNLSSMDCVNFSENDMQKNEHKAGKMNLLKERNQNIIIRLQNIEETVTSIEQLSIQWLNENKNMLKEKIAVYFLGAKEVIPDIEPMLEELDILDYAINHLDNSSLRNSVLYRKGVNTNVEE